MITAEGGTTACDVIPVGKSRRYQIGQADSYQWSASEGLRLDRQDAQFVEVTGVSASAAPGDRELTVTCGEVTERLAVTVVDLKSVTATISPTPPLGHVPAQYRNLEKLPERPAATFVSTGSKAEFPEVFDPTEVLVLLRGDFPAVPLEPVIIPAQAGITWSVDRSGDRLAEHKGESVPSLTESGPGAAVSPDATGAFVVRASPRCSCASLHDDMTIAVRLVLVDAVLLKDRTQVTDDSFISDQTSPFVFSKPYGETEVGTEIDTISFDVDIRVVSGGPDGKLYADQAIGLRWCNNILNEDSEAEAHYTGGKSVYSAYIMNTVIRHTLHLMDDMQSETLILGQILDTSEPVKAPEELNLATAHTAMKDDGKAGYVFTATCRDHPNKIMPLFYPRPGERQVLTGFRINEQFTAAVYLWSKSAPWAIGIACTMAWGTDLQYDIEGNPGSEENWQFWQRERRAQRGPARALDQITAADRAGIQVWEPGAADHFVMFLA
jgi:hypothetical protein